MRVVLTSLAARFYKKDGWTLDMLHKYVLSPKQPHHENIFHTFDEFNYLPDKYSLEYYIPDISTRMNLTAMINDGLIKPEDIDGKDMWAELKHLSHIEALKERLR